MSIFNYGPYTDLHRLDLDWVLEEVQKISDAGVENIIRSIINEMWENGTLAEIITDEVLENIDNRLALLEQEALFIFQENGDLVEPVGECMIMVLGHDAYIFDFGYRDPDTIITAMRDAGVARIKGIILSHYHDDHVGGAPRQDAPAINIEGMKEICNSFNTSGCKAYLPHHLLDWTQMIGDQTEEQTTEGLVQAYLAGKGITIVYPTEGYTVTIDPNTSLRFSNLDASYFTDYYSYQLSSTGADTGKTAYNNFSMVTEIFHLYHKVGYTGDIMEPAEANVLPAMQSANVFVVEHHGVNRLVNEDYVAAVTPEIAVIPTGAAYQDQKWFGKTDISKLLAGCEQVVITADARAVIIKSSTGGLICETANGLNLNMMYTMQSLTYGRMLNGTGIDLNDLTMPGEWSSQNVAQSTIIANAPFTYSGFKVQTIQLSPSGALLQIAYSSTTEGITIAYRRRDTTQTPTWHAWRYLLPSNYKTVLIESSDLTDCTVHNNSFNQCHAIMVNNTIDISLDIMTGANGVAEDTHIYTFDVDTYGRGAYFELVTPDLENRYLARLSFSTENRNYFIAPNVDLPANTHLIGHVTMVGYPFN